MQGRAFLQKIANKNSFDFFQELLNAPPDIPGNDVFVWRLGFIHYNASKFENRLM